MGDAIPFSLDGALCIPSTCFPVPTSESCCPVSWCYCSITGFAEHCTSFVLLAAYGTGANKVRRRIMHDDAGAPLINGIIISLTFPLSFFPA